MIRTKTAALALAAATAIGAIGCPSRDAELEDAPAPIGRQHPPPRRGPPSEMTGPMSGPHMMAPQCMAQMHERVSGIDQATRAIDEAKQSQDPSKITAALDLARAELQDIKQQHTMCMEMMRSRGRVPPQG